MTEVVKIELSNEMDLILAHKRSMKLAELCGISIIKQTSFATAVSEISRCVIGRDDYKSCLVLGINMLRTNRKELVAVLHTKMIFGPEHKDAIKYARRLAERITINIVKNESEVEIAEPINFSGLLNDSRIESFINYFKREPPLSPYDEIRKKNVQLLEMSERLKESEEQYRRLTETLPLMIFTCNATGHLNYANEWLRNHFGLVNLVPGKSLWYTLLDSTDLRDVLGLWTRAQEERAVFRVQAKLKGTLNRESLWHLISLVPILNDEKQIIGWTGFFVDVHAQKLVEETLKNNDELKAAQRQLLNYQIKLENNLQELNKSNHDLEQFAFIASHDLQEPLRKIRNFSEQLERNLNNPEKARLYAAKIDGAASRMTNLIKDVLNYSRLSKAGADFEEANLQSILDDVLNELELVIDEKKAKVISDKMPVIKGVPKQIHQLFYNLINNGLKFNEKVPEIKITCRQLQPGKDSSSGSDIHEKMVELNFSDNGIGFDPKNSNMIFTIFKRLNPKEKFEGTGIGLALCKKIVDNHHGKISVSSAPGDGATFRILLPVN